MPTKFQILQKKLLVDISEKLEAQNFAYHKQSYQRTVFDVNQSLCISFISHRNVDVTSSVWLRHNDLEQIISKFKPGQNDDVHNELATVGGWLGPKAVLEYNRWTIANDTDVARVVEDIVRCFNAVALPFFERYSQLEEILASCSNEYLPASRYCPDPFFRAEKAVAAAFLLNRQEEFANLVECKTQYLLSLKRRPAELELFVSMCNALMLELDKQL